MTTRRRRTVSETAEDNLNSVSSVSVSKQETAQTSVWPQLQGNFWSSPAPNNSYKKTDSLTNGADQRIDSTKYIGSTQSLKNNIQEVGTTDLFEMAARDRTHEFSRIIRLQQGNQVNNNLNKEKRPRDLRQYVDFMHRSKLVGRNISSTYAKLEKLTYLAKKRSLFDDSHDHEIQELTGIIRHDLTSLTKLLEDLQGRSKLSETKNSSGHLLKHSANLVGSLQTKVASITQKFKDVLEVRTENLKKQAERREQFAGGQVSRELPPAAVSGYHQGSVLLADEAAASSRNRNADGSYDAIIDMDDMSVSNPLGGATYQDQLQLVEEQDAYLQSRADTMKTIESTIVELGQMFTQLATMVQEQQEFVQRIDSNVDQAELNVEGAHTELLKYFKSVSSNRWLMIKVFGVLIVFFVVFVLFMS